MKGSRIMINVNFYDRKGETIEKTKEYETMEKALLAYIRAFKAGKIAGIHRIRTINDQPTVHH